MSQREPNTPALTAAEWEIMKILWQAGPLPARDVFAQLPSKRGWAYKTVKTLLSRLVAKNALAYEQIGNSYLYRAAIDREHATRQEVRSVLGRVISEAFSPVLAHFIDEADLSEADIRELKRRLNDKRKSAASEKRRP